MGSRINDYQTDLYSVDSATGWQLPIYRIRTTVTKEFPVFLQHGAGGTGAEWFEESNTDWILQLANLGYDVWVGNNSGTQHTTYVGSGTEEEAWDFTWADMGVKDVPAMLDLVLEVSGAEKITYMGYSQGTGQMFYGLAKMHDSYYKHVLNRFVALAACVYDDNEPSTFRGSRDYYGTMFNEAEVYYYGGPAAEQEANTAAVIEAFEGTKWADEAEDFNWYDWGEDPETTTSRQGLKNLMYDNQIWLNKRFQEPISDDEWLRGKRRSNRVSLRGVDTVPVTFFVNGEDYTCPLRQNKRLFRQIQSEKVWYVEQGQDHSFQFWFAGDTFLSMIVASIESGDPGQWYYDEYHTSQYSDEDNAWYDDQLMW